MGSAAIQHLCITRSRDKSCILTLTTKLPNLPFCLLQSSSGPVVGCAHLRHVISSSTLFFMFVLVNLLWNLLGIPLLLADKLFIRCFWGNLGFVWSSQNLRNYEVCHALIAMMKQNDFFIDIIFIFTLITLIELPCVSTQIFYNPVHSRIHRPTSFSIRSSL